MPRPGDTPRRFDPTEMALRGRIGAFIQHSRHDSRESTAKARKAFLASFERQVDPDGVLPEVERRRRAEHARKAYFARLALASARARTKRQRRNNGNTAVGQTAAAGEGVRDDAGVTRPSS
jgi:hypothetical protein